MLLIAVLVGLLLGCEGPSSSREEVSLSSERPSLGDPDSYEYGKLNPALRKQAGIFEGSNIADFPVRVSIICLKRMAQPGNGWNKTTCRPPY